MDSERFFLYCFMKMNWKKHGTVHGTETQENVEMNVGTEERLDRCLEDTRSCISSWLWCSLGPWATWRDNALSQLFFSLTWALFNIHSSCWCPALNSMLINYHFHVCREPAPPFHRVLQVCLKCQLGNTLLGRVQAITHLNYTNIQLPKPSAENTGF